MQLSVKKIYGATYNACCMADCKLSLDSQKFVTNCDSVERALMVSATVLYCQYWADCIMNSRHNSRVYNAYSTTVSQHFALFKRKPVYTRRNDVVNCCKAVNIRMCMHLSVIFRLLLCSCHCLPPRPTFSVNASSVLLPLTQFPQPLIFSCRLSTFQLEKFK